MSRHHRTRIFIPAIALLLLTGACSTGDGIEVSRSPDLQLVASLRPFSACDDLLGHLQSEALDRVGPYGLDGGPVIMEDFAESAVPSTAAGGDVAAAPSADSQAQQPAPDVSSTNVQEAGVDEPDLVKADGNRILAIAGGSLHWIDVSGDAPTDAGSVDLPDGYGYQMLVAGDQALVLVTGDTGGVVVDDVAPTTDAFVPPPSALSTTIAQLDVSAPDALAVTDTLEVEGSILDARMVGETARIVVTSSPENLDFVYPSTPTPGAEQAAEEANRQIIQGSTVADWLPSYRLDRGTADAESGQLVECDRMEQPSSFSGFGTLSVLTFDVAGELGTGDAVGVLATGENVYASAEHLYVATTDYPEVPETDPTNDFPPRPPAPTTAIHRFAIDGDGPAEYELSGTVRGRLLDQFSMSEGGEAHDQLRVATTDDDTQESYVSVLEANDDQLTEVGQVGGLGEGEQIYSVRFVGDVAYVVTFEQTDPLYTVDLSDPAAPSVVGELELLGYSAYLHPIGENLLLGIGQDATAEGMTTGTQLSLFDVSDPADPTRLQHAVIPGASSAAEYDHHAFLYWPETGLAVLPVQSYGGDIVCGDVVDPTTDPCTDTSSFSGAVGFHVDPAGIDEVGRITHDDGSTLARSVVVGDTLYTLSDTSLASSDLTTLAPESTLALN